MANPTAVAPKPNPFAGRAAQPTTVARPAATTTPAPKPAEVQPTATAEPTKTVAPRPSYLTICPSEELNEAGLLCVVPKHINYKKHALLGKDDFATEDVYLDFRATELEQRVELLTKQAARLRRDAESSRKYGGSSDQRKKVQKVQRLHEQLAELQAALEAEGIDLSEITGDTDEGVANA